MVMAPWEISFVSYELPTLTAEDLQARLSVKTGTEGNSVASTPAASLGKYLATSRLGGGIGNLFRAVTPSEAGDGVTTYRCMFFANLHPTISLEGTVVWIRSQIAGGADIQIGLDPAGVTDLDESSAQAAEIASESVPPTGVTFSLATTPDTGLAVGTVAPGECFALWVKRRVAAGARALAADGAVLSITGTESF